MYYQCVQPFEYIISGFSLITVDSQKCRRREQPEGSGHSSRKNFEFWCSERQQFLSKTLAKPVIIVMLITVFMTSCTRESWLCNFFLFEAKAEIRRLLPEGLQESISKVRSSVVRCYIAICLKKHNKVCMLNLEFVSPLFASITIDCILLLSIHTCRGG